jgi:hypothetical protein
MSPEAARTYGLVDEVLVTAKKKTDGDKTSK